MIMWGENRGQTLQGENRGQTLQEQNRDLTLQGENRGQTLQGENRDQTLQGEKRGQILQGEKRGQTLQGEKRGQTLQGVEGLRGLSKIILLKTSPWRSAVPWFINIMLLHNYFEIEFGWKRKIWSEYVWFMNKESCWSTSALFTLT